MLFHESCCFDDHFELGAWIGFFKASYVLTWEDVTNVNGYHGKPGKRQITTSTNLTLLHWEKSWENFGKILYVSQNFPIFFSKWANNSPILRKKWESFGRHAGFSQHFLAISPSVL